MTILDTNIERLGAQEAATGRFFEPAFATPDVIDKVIESTVEDIDEQFLAFRGMGRSPDAFEHAFNSVPTERIHETALYIAKTLELHLHQGPLTLARTRRYFMLYDSARDGEINWLTQDNETTYAAFTPPSDPDLLDSLVVMATPRDEARLIDDVLTHAFNVRSHREREAQEARVEQAQKRTQELKDHHGITRGAPIEKNKSPWQKNITSHKDPGKIEKITQGFLFWASRNFQTGEVIEFPNSDLIIRH